MPASDVPVLRPSRPIDPGPDLLYLTGITDTLVSGAPRPPSSRRWSSSPPVRSSSVTTSASISASSMSRSTVKASIPSPPRRRHVRHRPTHPFVTRCRPPARHARRPPPPRSPPGAPPRGCIGDHRPAPRPARTSSVVRRRGARRPARAAADRWAAHGRGEAPAHRATPRCPGVYEFVDASGRVLYVGKATNLRQRVRSYSRPTNDARSVHSSASCGRSATSSHRTLAAEVVELRHLRCGRRTTDVAAPRRGPLTSS